MAKRTPICNTVHTSTTSALVRTPVSLPDDTGLVDKHGRLKGSLSMLLSDNHFEITEEDLEDAAEQSVSGDVPDSAWEGLTKQMIRSSCAFFAQEVLTGPLEPPYYGKFFVSEHHEEWDDLVCRHDRICVLAARDHGKTFWFNFAYPLWRVSTMPWGKGFILSATAPQAERILEDIVAEVEGNPKLQWLIPTRKESRKWSSRYVRFSNGHRIYARGFGTKVRGFHPDYIVCDDVLNDETIYSEMIRRKQTDYFYTAVSNMVVPGGQLIVVGTPLHKSDLYRDLKDNDEYEYCEYPSTPEKPLWAERYSVEALQRKKREIGSVRFTREFAVNPVSDDMSLFPVRLFRGDPIEQFNITLGMPVEFWEKAGIIRFIGVDLAMSASVSADFTVIWTMGLDDFGNRWIIDIQRKRGLPYQEQLSLINTVARKYDPALIFIEDNAMQRIFGDELIRTTDLPIRKFTTTLQKNSLDKGVPSLRVLLENGKFRIPRGDKHSVEQTDIWIDEMRSFTWQDGKLLSVGGHDDTVLAAWICDQAIRQGGFQFSFGDKEYEGSLDDFMNELTGGAADDMYSASISDDADNSTSANNLDNADNADNSSDAGRTSKGRAHGVAAKQDLSQLQGDDLLRALLKQKMGRRRKGKPPGNVAVLSLKSIEPGVNDLVNENDFL